MMTVSANTVALVAVFFTAGFLNSVNSHDSHTEEEHMHVFAVPMIFQPLVEHQPRVIITTTSLDPVDVTVSVVGIGFNINTTVTRYKQSEIALPTSVRLTTISNNNKTVIVKSSGVVSVHCIDNEYESGDGFLVLPNSQLKNKFYIASYVPFYHEKEYHPAFFCVSALQEETVVAITTKSGQKHQIPLKPYESYRFDGGSFEDLTGTLVESTHPVSVVSGVFTRVPQGSAKGADGLLEQIPPVDSWGRNFILAPFLGRASGYVYRVLAGTQSATLGISNHFKEVEIQADEWFEGDVLGDTVIAINSDHPVLVFQYMKSNQADDPFEPSMMMVPPIDSYNDDVVTFPVFNCTFVNDFQYSINVILGCKYASGLMLDETTSMSDWRQLKTDDNTMCVLRGNVMTGVHSVSHEDPAAKFTVAVYGLHRVSSYAYPAGFKPGNKQGNTILQSAIIGVAVGCLVLLAMVFIVVLVKARRSRKIPKPHSEIYSTLDNQAL